MPEASFARLRALWDNSLSRKTWRIQDSVHEQWQGPAPEEAEVWLVGEGDDLAFSVRLADEIDRSLQAVDRFVPGHAGDERLLLFDGHDVVHGVAHRQEGVRAFDEHVRTARDAEGQVRAIVHRRPERC